MELMYALRKSSRGQGPIRSNTGEATAMGYDRGKGAYWIQAPSQVIKSSMTNIY